MGKFLYPSLGFNICRNILKVSVGFGSHLPVPCSLQVSPLALATMVPVGKRKVSIIFKLPCSFFCTLSNSINDFSTPSNVLEGKILLLVTLPEIFEIRLRYRCSIS